MRTVLGEVGVTGLGRPHLFSMSWGRARWKESGQEVSRPLGVEGDPPHILRCAMNGSEQSKATSGPGS